MTNRYKADCSNCGASVSAGEGILSKESRFRRKVWKVTCQPCSGSGTEENKAALVSRGNETSYAVVTSTGWVGYRNRQGRCEDAPCCGCCTF